MSIKLPYKVKDIKSIQKNFDYVSVKLASGLTKTITKGPIAGDGAAISNGLGQYRNLTGLVITYKTGPVPERAVVRTSVRADSAVAAWCNFYLAFNVSPAPITRLLANAVAGGAPISGSDLLDITYVHSAGPLAGVCQGEDTMLLAANTNYTFQVLGAGSGAAGSVVWTTTTENVVIGRFWPEP